MRLDPQDEQSALKELVQKNLDLTEENLRLTRKIRRHFMWDRLFGLVKLAIIIVPIIAAGYYLKPYLAQLQTVYQQVLGIQQQFQQIGNVTKQIGDTQKKLQNLPQNIPDLKNIPDVNKLLPELLKSIK